MVMGATKIDNMITRMSAVEASLRAAFESARIVTRKFQPYQNHLEADLKTGVVTLVSRGEKNYADQPGLVGKEGTHAMRIWFWIQVPKDASSSDIELAEMQFIEDAKTWARAGIPGMFIVVNRSLHSQQIETPYGWALVDIEVLPPFEN